MEVLTRVYPPSIMSILNGDVTGLAIEPYSVEDDDDDTVIFQWCHYGSVLASFPFSPRDTEASDLRDFLQQVHTMDWYRPARLPKILLLAEVALAEAKKSGYFCTLEDLASLLEGEDVGVREAEEITQRAGDQLSLIENFSFGSLLKSHWLVNYFVLGLGCSGPVVSTLVKTLEKLVKIVDK